mgnify:FL=1
MTKGTLKLFKADPKPQPEKYEWLPKGVQQTSEPVRH